MPLIHGRFELVLFHGFDGLFIQPHSEMTYQLNVLRIPLRIDNELDRNAALKICPTRVLCKLRLNGMDDFRCSHSTTHAHQTTTVAATAARTRSAAVAGPDTTAQSLAKSRAATSSLRGHSNLWRLGHAEIG